MSSRPTISRRDLLRFRVRRHQLDRPPGTARSRLPDILDYGIQDTGGDGAAWALAIRGAPPGRGGIVLAWTLRGAPHAYRRDDIRDIAVATAPYTEDDASKRVFTASKPFRAAGLPILDAMRTMADHQRRIVTKPPVKGEVSRCLAQDLDDTFLRWCNPCQAIHPYEQLFRLPALQGGLVLDWDTSPPVLRRLTKVKPLYLQKLATEAVSRFDVIRNHLRFYPGARVRDVAEFIDAPMKVVKAYWPTDSTEVTVKDDPTAGKVEPRFVLDADVDQLRAEGPNPTLRLLGPFDPYLQLRDRELLVDKAASRKDVWRILGRPGAIVLDGEVMGTWRPKTAGKKFTINADLWRPLPRAARKELGDQAERLAAHRDVTLAGVSA
jgi:hypothetical protein